MKNALIAYVASPVGGFYRLDPANAKGLVLERAVSYCRVVKNAGMVPLSTPICFIDIFDETTEREKALNSCIEILKKCDVFVYSKKDLEGSSGIQLELQVANEIGLKIVEIENLMDEKCF